MPGWKKTRQCTQRAFIPSADTRGVVWFFFLYLFLALFTGQGLMMAVCICYSGLNVLYVWFQDRVTFKRTLSGYEAYQRETPFLIPTGKSIRKCAGYFRTMEEDGDEI